MSLPFGLTKAIAALALATVGATVYSTAGFGLALVVAAPLHLIHGPFVPGPIMAAGLVLRVLLTHKDRSHIDFSGMTFAVFGRVGGTLAAAVFLLYASESQFEIVFATMLLIGVGASAAGLHVEPNRVWALLAGFLSGLMGTVSSLGGPPMALLYQHTRLERLRGTLAGYSVLGTVVSIAALATIGRYGMDEVILSLFLLPGMILGFLLSIPLHGILKDRGIRPLLLGLCLFSAVVVLWRAVV